ncbi:MAG: hypothetical protein IIY81_12995 [Lachnospiraceae bacterium]|nr:hypothetical protein [Lachnospiraceae bacterium]
MSETLKNQDESVDSNNQWDTLSDEKSWNDRAKEVSNIEESSGGPVSVPKPEGTIPSPKRPDSESNIPVSKPEFMDSGTGYEGTGLEMSSSEKIKNSTERINNEIAKDAGTEKINMVTPVEDNQKAQDKVDTSETIVQDAPTSDQEVEDALKDLGTN